MRTCRRTMTAMMILSAAAVAGCTHRPSINTDRPDTTSTVGGYQVPANIHFSEHWVQTPTVDLMSPDGTFIRAFIEAEDVRIFNLAKKKGSYPGFTTADRTTNHAGGEFKDVYGYTTNWVLTFTESADNTVTALVCSYGSINPDNNDFPTLSPLTLRYARTGAPPPANQHGQARAPSVPVFGDWYATFLGYEAPGQPDITPCKNSQPPIDKSPVSRPGWPGPEAA